jgi:hypothetical protein
MKYLSEQISYQEHLNKQIVLNIWKYIANGGKYTKKDVKNHVDFYESIFKKLKKYSLKYEKSFSQICSDFLSLDGIFLDQILENWNIKPEKQNKNEFWKKQYIEENSKIKVNILPKSEKGSLVLTESFEIFEKEKKTSQTKKSEGMKSFDMLIQNSKYPKTEGYDGILTVDKTVKVSGGSQNDVQREIDTTIKHLSMDPKKRHYLILLDGDFWSQYVIEYQNKYSNIHVTNSDLLITKSKNKL